MRKLEGRRKLRQNNQIGLGLCSQRHTILVWALGINLPTELQPASGTQRACTVWQRHFCLDFSAWSPAYWLEPDFGFLLVRWIVFLNLQLLHFIPFTWLIPVHPLDHAVQQKYDVSHKWESAMYFLFLNFILLKYS